MLLIIAFALFVLLIAAWITMPGASTTAQSEEPLSTALPVMGSHSA